jgi:hypothetical protein
VGKRSPSTPSLHPSWLKCAHPQPPFPPYAGTQMAIIGFSSLAKRPAKRYRGLLSRTLNLSWGVVIIFEETDRQAFVTGSLPGGVFAGRGSPEVCSAVQSTGLRGIMVNPWYNDHGRDNETRSGRSYSYNMLVTTMSFLIWWL